MHYLYSLPVLFSFASVVSSTNTTVDLSWHPPPSTKVSDLQYVINSTGVFGDFIFNSSTTPAGLPYSTYNWCNMPHVRSTEYPKVNSSYKLQYIHVIHRHHKRTPYAANTFPVESYAWECSDEGLYYNANTFTGANANSSALTYWSVFTSPSNPLAPQGFNGTCQFPQLTAGGLDDSHQHGKDIYGVYHGLLGFLPAKYDSRKMQFRVTNNVITSQVASNLIPGMFSSLEGKNIPLLIQPDSIDSLEPAYTCSSASTLYSSYGVGSTNAN
ncbi:phosphoglycerate mutase-like protein, partial [Aureobasidium melanogenum]